MFKISIINLNTFSYSVPLFLSRIIKIVPCYFSGRFTKSVPSKVTIKVKGGTAVDPDSELEDVAHVYKKGPDIYSTVLGLTDLQSGTNKYYKLQILESDKGHR